MTSRRLAVRLLLCVTMLLARTTLAAQDHQGHAAPAAEQNAGWQWQADAAAFFGVNHQHRKFRDFTAWEAQNWMMATGTRGLRRARVRLKSMISLEPFTLEDIGSPQVFQTGETYQGGALIDYQHPHDLLMALGADIRVP